MGRRNVTLKDGRKGCVMVSSDLLNICSTQDVEILYGDYNDLMATHGIDHLYHCHIGEVEVSEWLHRYLTPDDASSVCESLDGLMRYGLVT